MAKVAVTHGQPIRQPIQEALRHMPLQELIRGKVVAVKPNETVATEQDKSGVTQPDTLRAVLSELERFEPRELIVTGGAGAAETEDVFRIAGLMQVVEETGATFVDHNRPPFQRVDLEYAPERGVQGPQKFVFVNPRVLEYETLISLAQLKLHTVATVTLSMKNIAMSYPAADYYGHPRSEKTHDNAFFDDMHSFIVAMIKRFRPQLAIIVGHPAMIGTGPVGGYPVETGIVIASTDPVAADAVGAKLLGFQAQAVRHLWEAKRWQLGETDPDKMHFCALSMQEAIARFTRAAYGKGLEF